MGATSRQKTRSMVSDTAGTRAKKMHSTKHGMHRIKINKASKSTKETGVRETDMFGYGDMLSMTDAMRDAICGRNGAVDMGDIMKYCGVPASFNMNQAKTGAKVQYKAQEVGEAINYNIARIMEDTREWMQDSMRNTSGVIKDIIKSTDSQDKIDSIYRYVLSQFEHNTDMVRSRIDARYRMLSALAAACDGRKMDATRNIYQAFMGQQ